jgi:hypothetical protein
VAPNRGTSDLLGAGEGVGLGQLTLSHGSLAPPRGPDHGLAVVRTVFRRCGNLWSSSRFDLKLSRVGGPRRPFRCVRKAANPTGAPGWSGPTTCVVKGDVVRVWGRRGGSKGRPFCSSVCPTVQCAQRYEGKSEPIHDHDGD